MLGLWCRWCLVFLLIVLLNSLWLLLLLLWLSLWLLLLLWWGVDNGLLNESRLASNSGENFLVGDSLVPTGGVWVLCAPLLVEDKLETASGNTGGVEVGEGEALANEVGVDQEVVLEDLQAVASLLLGILNVFLVVRVLADEWAEPACESGEELGGCERAPLEDRGVVLLGLTEKGGLFVLGGNCALLVIV